MTPMYEVIDATTDLPDHAPPLAAMEELDNASQTLIPHERPSAVVRSSADSRDIGKRCWDERGIQRCNATLQKRCS